MAQFDGSVMTFSAPSFFAAAIKLLMPPHFAADVAGLQLAVDADAEPPASATPTSVVLSKPAATDTFSLFANTCTAS